MHFRRSSLHATDPDTSQPSGHASYRPFSTYVSAKMKPLAIAGVFLGLISAGAAESPQSTTKQSVLALPTDFKPPQVFKNANLVHIISLEKSYVKENINVLIENISPEPQDEYFLPFTPDHMARVGGFEIKDRKDAGVGPFKVEAVEYDPQRFVNSDPGINSRAS
jgi:oligosaccharyltransferase complex subunit alpha (ribophorin I)